MCASGLAIQLDLAGGRLKEGKAALQRANQPAVLAQRKRADPLRKGPLVDAAGAMVEPPQATILDVDPVECLLGDVPDRHLAELVAGAVDFADVGHRLPPRDVRRSIQRETACRDGPVRSAKKLTAASVSAPVQTYCQ